MRTTHRRVGALTCTVVDGEEAPHALVVLCHGYGAPGDDLVPLADGLAASSGDRRIRYVFPEAPEEVPGSWGGRAWWPLDAERYVVRVARGELDQVMDEVPAGLPRARRALRGALETLLQEADLGWDRLVLGGFSQGAMLATDLTLRLDERPAGLLVMSGALVARAEWTRLAPRRAGLPVLQSHGRSDPMLPFEAAQALGTLLIDAGLAHRWEVFGGGHTIPSPVAAAAAACVSQVLA